MHKLYRNLVSININKEALHIRWPVLGACDPLWHKGIYRQAKFRDKHGHKYGVKWLGINTDWEGLCKIELGLQDYSRFSSLLPWCVGILGARLIGAEVLEAGLNLYVVPVPDVPLFPTPAPHPGGIYMTFLDFYVLIQ